MIRSVTRSITKQILNEDTGEIEPFKFVEDSRFKNSFKKGWRMYYTNYDDMLEKVIRSSKDVAMLHYLKEKINRDFELNIKEKKWKKNYYEEKMYKKLYLLQQQPFMQK